MAEAEAKPASQGSDPAALSNPADTQVRAKLDPEVAKDLPDNLSKFFNKEGEFDFSAASTSVKQAEQKITELSTAPAAAPATPADDLKINRGAPGAESSVKELLAKAGTSEEAVAKEYVENQGKLTEKTYKALRAEGVTRPMADLGARAFALEQQAGQQAVAAALQSARDEASGGAEGVDGSVALRNLLDWAGRSGAFDVEEMNAIDAQLDHPSTTRMAVQTLKARYQQEYGAGRAEPLLEGAPAAAGGGLQLTKDNVHQVMAGARAGKAREQRAIMAAQQDGSLPALLL